MVRLRLISMALAALVVAGIVYLAVTQRFHAVTDIFSDTDAIKVEIEQKDKPPPPPPPPPRERPPPPPPMTQRIPPPDLSAPPTPTELPVQEQAVNPPAPPAPPAPPSITAADFIQRPDGNDLVRYYPDRALERERTGRATVRCGVNATGRLVSCSVVSEDPSGWGFGEASVRAAQREFRVRPQLENGQPTDGGNITFTISWRL